MDVITNEECVRDYTFRWTAAVNDFLSHRPLLTDRYIIFCSFLMDVMLISVFVSWLIYWKSFRVILTYLLFFGVRSQIQNNFLMPRLPGFLFRYPGFPSVAVPYHDSNDFYYSGHVGTCFILVLETGAKKWRRAQLACILIMINQWVMMMFLRAHYFMDMVTGLIVAHYMHILAEKLSYLVDVKLLR